MPATHYHKYMYFTMQAIEKDDVDNLKVAVDAMKAAKFPGENCLDVCEMVLDPRTTDKYYPMTLLAFTGYHARFEMLDILIEEGASKPCSCIVPLALSWRIFTQSFPLRWILFSCCSPLLVLTTTIRHYNFSSTQCRGIFYPSDFFRLARIFYPPAWEL